MKKTTLILGLFAITFCQMYSQNKESDFSKSEVKQVMKQVADWQIEHQKEVKHQPLGWENAALYMGMIDFAEIAETEDKDDKYYKFVYNIGRREGWQPAKRMYHADDICISQIYIDLYRKYNQEPIISPTYARTQWVIVNPPPYNMELDYGKEETLYQWTWCDALYMAPPVYVKLYMMTNNEAYMKFADKEYKDSYNYLYDKEEKLFYRDWRYFGKKEANGKKVFWGRGNGWVLGGLSEILKELPKGNKYRKFYEDLFIEMSERIIECQQPDGYWRASLLDPDSYPSPETSSTGFITYALAYGVNEGILPANKFMPSVKKGWKALTDAVFEDGKLGYVQPIGADPRHVEKDMTEVYGVGAFLLAGNEIYRMAK